MKTFKPILVFSVFSLVLGFDFSCASSVIFSDGFEDGFVNWTGNDSRWDTTSGGNTDRHGGKARADVRGNTEPGDDMLLKNISTAGLDGITLEFWYKIKDSLEEDDHVYLEWSGDSSSWNVVVDFVQLAKSADWQSASYSLPIEADDKENFGIRFRAVLGSGGDVFYLDDVVLSANSGSETALAPIPELTPTPIPETVPTPPSAPVSIASSTPTPLPPAPTPVLTPVLTPALSPPQILKSPSLTPKLSKTPISIAETPVSLPAAFSSTPIPDILRDDSAKNEKTAELLFENPITASTPGQNLSAHISGFFQNSKFFWLIGSLIVIVVLSVPKSKD